MPDNETNPFDQFDRVKVSSDKKSEGPNPFDQFDAPKEPTTTPERLAVAPFVGFNRGTAEIVGAPVDAMTWVLNKALPSDEQIKEPVMSNGKPGAAYTTIQHQIHEPVMGSEFIKKGMGLIGANPDEMQPRTTAERWLQAGGAGAATAAIPMGATGALARSGARTIAPRTMGYIESAFGTGSTAGEAASNTAMGLTSGIGAEAATDLPYQSPYLKPLAGMVGGFGGGLIGAGGSYLAGQVPVLARTAKDYIAPLFRSGQERMAGQILAEAGGGKQALLDELASAQPSGVPGSKPTTFQLTGEQGVGQLERQAETANPQPFLERRQEANAARREALSQVAPEGNSQQLVDYLSKNFDALEHDSNYMQAIAQAFAKEKLDALGGKATPEESGKIVRESLEEAKNAARKVRNQLYDIVDPNGSLNIVTTPLREQSVQISDVGKLAKPLEGEEAAILKKMQQMDNVTPLTDVRDLDQRISAAMSEERRTKGETPTYARLVKMKAAVKNSINESIANQSAFEQAAVAAGKMNPEETMAGRANKFAQDNGTPGTKSAEPDAATTGQFNIDPNNYKIFYPHGNITARYEVVNAPDLVTSHDLDFRVNPQYPQNLQPRNRANVANQSQVNEISSKLNPELLGPAPEVNSGAPIIGPDNVVESGNGRSLAIQKAYQQGRGDDYRAWLESKGFDTTGMDQPVLVARRTTPMTEQERELFAHSAAGKQGGSLSAGEQAATDARMVNAMNIPPQFGAMTDPANRPFATSFVSRLPANERGTLLDAQGNLSVDGAKRIQAAVTSHAYGDPNLISRAFESTDNNIKNISNALNDAAGPWSEMRKAISQGDISASHDVTQDLLDAVHLVMRAKDEGKPLTFYLNQQDMFGNPMTAMMKDIITPDGVRIAGRDKIAQKLKNYAEGAVANTKDQLVPAEDPSNILRAGINKADREIPETIEPAGNVPGETPIFTGKPELQPNMTAEAAAKMKAANAYNAGFNTTFKEGPVGQVLKTNGWSGQYPVMDSQVVGKFFPAGDKGYESAMAFRNAVKNDAEAINAMQDFIAYSANKAARTSDGTLDPTKFAAWQKSHSEALRAFPELQPLFADAVKASETMAQVAADHAAQIKAYQQGVVGKLLNLSRPEDIPSTIGGIFNAKDSVSQMSRLANLAKKDPDAMQGLQKAVADYINQKFITTTEAGTSGQNLISSAAFQKFLAQNEAALGEVFGKDQLDAMKAIALDLQRSARSVSGNALPGRSTTAQDLYKIANAKKESQLGLFAQLAVAAGGGAQASGPAGSLAAMGSVLGKHIVGNAREAGIQNVRDILTEALLNPDMAKTLLMKVPPKPGQGSDLTLGTLLRRNSVYSGVDAGKYGYDYSKNPNNPRSSVIANQTNEITVRPRAGMGYAKGGRVMDSEAEGLIREASRIRSHISDHTEQMLSLPDDAIVSALNVAKRTI